jgi:hypothetical protein
MSGDPGTATCPRLPREEYCAIPHSRLIVKAAAKTSRRKRKGTLENQRGLANDAQGAYGRIVAALRGLVDLAVAEAETSGLDGGRLLFQCYVNLSPRSPGEMWE